MTCKAPDLEQKPGLFIEPRGIVDTGAAGGALTAQNDVWI